MRRTGLVLLGSVATPFVAAAVLAAEWKLAKRGPQLAAVDFREGGLVGEGEPAHCLVWLGDSLVTGAGASSPDAALPRLVARALGVPCDVRILAVAGSGVRRLVAEQLPLLGEVEADAVVVCIGTNDVLYRTGPAEVRRAARELLAAVPDGAALVVAGPCDWGAVVRVRQPLRAVMAFAGRQVARALRHEVTAGGGTFVDMGAATGPAFRRDPDGLLAADRFHPGDAGYRLIADAIAPAVEQALAAPRGTDGVGRHAGR